jgi:hypothetical protein
MARHLPGVTGVTNAVTAAPPMTAERVAEQVEEAFKREPEIDTRHTRVKVADHFCYRHSPDLKAGASALTCGSGSRADRPSSLSRLGATPAQA